MADSQSPEDTCSKMSMSNEASPATETLNLSPGDFNVPIMKPNVIQIQTDNGIQVIYDTTSEEIVSSEPVNVGVGNDTFEEGLSNYQACVICGDRGSGYHYSTLSCEGCKGFFKRTVQKNLVYSCKGSGMCIINKTTRNNCQCCRYQKCLQYGMKREAVREDRSPGGKHRTKKPKLDESLEDASLMTSTAKHSLDQEHSDVINTILESNPERIPARDPSKAQEDVSIQELMEYGYLELKYIIEWAKKVTDFRSFTMDDQMALLKSAFMELSVFRMSHRSLPYEDSLYFAKGIILHKSVCENMGWGQELVHATLEFSTRLRDLHIDKVEFAMMGAIVLTYPDAIGLVDKKAVTTVQTKFLDVLRRYETSTYPQDKGRFGKILLRLPTLRTLSAKAAERFLSLTLEGVLPLNELVQEMMC